MTTRGQGTIQNTERKMMRNNNRKENWDLNRNPRNKGKD